MALHLAITVCRRNPVCFVELKESFIIKKFGGRGRVSFVAAIGYEVEPLISAVHRAQPTGVIQVPVEDRRPR